MYWMVFYVTARYCVEILGAPPLRSISSAGGEITRCGFLHTLSIWEYTTNTLENIVFRIHWFWWHCFSVLLGESIWESEWKSAPAGNFTNNYPPPLEPTQMQNYPRFHKLATYLYTYISGVVAGIYIYCEWGSERSPVLVSPHKGTQWTCANFLCSIKLIRWALWLGLMSNVPMWWVW